jgi:hypothetical protein
VTSSSIAANAVIFDPVSPDIQEMVQLCWLLGSSVLEKRDTTGKQPGALKTNWPILSACHAGFLGDNPRPVGSVNFFQPLPQQATCVPEPKCQQALSLDRGVNHFGSAL